MPIDTTVPQSPGWWMARLWKQLQAKQSRLNRLELYYQGRPPLVLGSMDVRSAFYRFQATSRSNFAALVVQAPREKLKVRSIRTAADSDEDGDSSAWEIWLANNLQIDEADVYRMAFTMSESYVIVGMGDDGKPVITAEDPRQVVTAQDPVNPRKTLAALKVFHDDVNDQDLAYLWLPGQMWVATRDRKARVTADVTGPTPVSFSAGSFDFCPFDEGSDPAVFDVGGQLPAPDYDGVMSETFTIQDVPVVRFQNRDGIGEFEHHTDLIDRIHHMILQRLVIATLQAFRQRAILLDPTIGDGDGGLPEFDDEGRKIDYDDLFAADPGALWKLPPGAKIWESDTVDLTGILSSVKDDVLHLAAVTRTPLTMFTPDAATQTAEGASLQRDGQTTKVEDRQTIWGRGWAMVISLAFRMMGQDDQADLGKLSVDWMPAERYSLAEMSLADMQNKSLPLPTALRKIWQLNTDEIDRAMSEHAQEQIQAAALALQQANEKSAQTLLAAAPAGPSTDPAASVTPDDAAA